MLLVSPTRDGDDARLLKLIKGSEEFDRIARARIFLDTFRLSELRPEVLMIYSLAAEEAAVHLSRDASRRLDAGEMTAGGAPVFELLPQLQRSRSLQPAGHHIRLPP